jgi:hypothetical protein
MTRFPRVLTVGLVVVGVAVATATSALADDESADAGPPPPPPPAPRLIVPPSELATFFGITPAALRDALRSGESLADVASANGQTTAALETFITTEAKEYLDDAVADGRITADQAATRLQRLTDHVDDVVTRTGPPPPPPPPPPRAAARNDGTPPSAPPAATAPPTGQAARPADGTRPPPPPPPAARPPAPRPGRGS